MVNDVAVQPPGKLTGALLSADVLVYSQNTLARRPSSKIKAIKGVDRRRADRDGRSSSSTSRK